MVAYSMVCDCYSGDKRLVAMSYIWAIFMLANCIAPAVGSWLLNRGLLWPVYCAVGGLSGGFLVCLLMPETHPRIRMLLSNSASESSGTAESDGTDNELSFDKSPSSLRRYLEMYSESLRTVTVLTRGRKFAALGFISFAIYATDSTPQGKSIRTCTTLA